LNSPHIFTPDTAKFNMAGSLRVLIIGGYGEFGGRLCELLLRDGHAVIVAGRQIKKAEQFCLHNDAKPLQLNINTDLHRIASLNVDVVVDAAGPFQSYGDDDQKYRVALTALSCDAHYLDLSDDGNFTQGIVTLDNLAKKHNRFALSGASSTPALSGAAVSAMQSQFSTIEKIESSIFPGSRAPQGNSVMQAILAQVGNPVDFWREGAWVKCKGWSEPTRKSIGQHITREANLISTADVVLFPEHFNARTVLFRGGLAVPIMHKSLQWLGSLRRRSWLPVLTKFIKPLRLLANLITPFGSDRGGMLVEITGCPTSALATDADKFFKATWTLKAEPSYGPYVPTIAARAIIRNISMIEPGARACISELPLKKYVDAMQDIDVTTTEHTNEFNYLFKTSLNKDWEKLPEPLRQTHRFVDRKILTGTAKVTRGTSPIGKLIAWVFRFPAARDNIPVQVTKTRVGDSEIWDRDFDGQTFRSTLSTIPTNSFDVDGATIQEQFGLLKFALQLPIFDEAMHMNVLSGSCLGIPIPTWLLPISDAREYVQNNRMHFSVELLGPLKTGLIVRYEGSLE